MPEYRRAFAPGATFFFTVVTNFRRPILADPWALQALRAAIHDVRQAYSFRIDAIVVLPDHLHCIWRLPNNDSDFSLRWRLIKGQFSQRYLSVGGHEPLRSASRYKRKERGVWQRRFWEHVVRDEDEYASYVDYVHYNPVKHGHATCPHAWEYSSFHRWVNERAYVRDWCCCCAHTHAIVPDFSELEELTGE